MKWNGNLRELVAVLCSKVDEERFWDFGTFPQFLSKGMPSGYNVPVCSDEKPGISFYQNGSCFGSLA